MSLRSIIGPTTRNASRAVSENCVRPAATNASASEHTDKHDGEAGHDQDGERAGASPAEDPFGATVCNVATTSAAPITRNPPACTKSVMAVARTCRPAVPCRALGPAAHPASPTSTRRAPRHCREQRGDEAGPGHLRMRPERDRGRDDDDRIDRRRREQERERRGGFNPRAPGDWRPAPRCIHNPAAPRQAGDGHREHASRQHTGERLPGRTPRCRAPTATPRSRNGSACNIVAMKTVDQLRSSGPEPEYGAIPGRGSTGRCRARRRRGAVDLVAGPGPRPSRSPRNRDLEERSPPTGPGQIYCRGSGRSPRPGDSHRGEPAATV